jgi:hypothetical protein
MSRRRDPDQSAGNTAANLRPFGVVQVCVEDVMTTLGLLLGTLLVGTGFVTFVWKLHDRSMHESLALFRNRRGGVGTALIGFVSLIVPIVSSIATGLAFVAAGVLSR